MITQEEIKNLLHYSPTSGKFIWKNERRGTRGKGMIAGYDKHGYNYITIRGKGYRSGRLAFLYMEGYFPEHCVDHIDRNRSNDKWNNLRHVSYQCNNRNCNIYPNNTSGVKGVYWHKNRKRWYAKIKINKKHNHIGCFIDFNEAVCHRFAAEQCLDWSGCDSSSPAFQYVKTMLSK